MKKMLPIFFALLVFGITLSACNRTNSAAETNATLDGATWMLLSLNGQTVLAESEVTAVFNPDENRMNGLAGCNNYFAEYEVDGDMLSITAPGATRMICAEPDGLMQQEDTYLQSLSTIANYKIQDDKLEMTNSSGERVLVFVSKQSG